MASSSAGGGGEDQPVKRTYDLVDPTTIQCLICREPGLFPPVFQCRNGHMACSKCVAKMAAARITGCHMCRDPIRTIPCPAVDKVLESLRVTCKYAAVGGCKEMLKCYEIEEHERSCTFKSMKSQYDLVDPDDRTLKCTSCRTSLPLPVFKISRLGCSSCSQSIGRIQRVEREKVLESLGVTCEQSGARKGCNLEMEKHDTLCKYGTYHCPVTNCGHDTLLDEMFDHIANVHEYQTMSTGDVWNSIVLDPPDRIAKFSMSKNGKRFMIINTKTKGLSVLVYCSEIKEKPGVLSFCCTTLGASELLYNLKVKQAGDGNSASYFLEALAPSLHRKGGSPSCKREYLVTSTVIKADEVWVFDVELRLACVSMCVAN